MPKFSQLIRFSFLCGLIIIQFLIIINYINQNSTVESQTNNIVKNITQEQDKQKALRNNLQQDINEEIRRTLTQSQRSGSMARIETNTIVQLPGGVINNSNSVATSEPKPQITKPLFN